METRWGTADSMRQGDPIVIGHPGRLVIARPSCGIEKTLRFTGIAPTICVNGALITCNKDSDVAYDCICGNRHIATKDGTTQNFCTI